MVDHVGKRVKGVWILDGTPMWYKGIIVNYAFDNNLHTVIFDDGDESKYNLEKSVKKCSLVFESDTEDEETANLPPEMGTDYENKGDINSADTRERKLSHQKRPRPRGRKHQVSSSLTGKSKEDNKVGRFRNRDIKEAIKLSLSEVEVCKRSRHGRKLNQVQKLDWCSNLSRSYDEDIQDNFPQRNRNTNPVLEPDVFEVVAYSDDESDGVEESDQAYEVEVEVVETAEPGSPIT